MNKIITLGLLFTFFLGFSQTQEIDSLTIQLAFQKQDTLKADTSLKLIKSLYDAGEYNRALKYILESEKLATDLNYNHGLAEINYYKALIYTRKDDYINAISSYSKSKLLFSKLQDTLGIARVNNSIGIIEIKRGNYSKGLQHALSAINVLEKRNLKNDLNLAYSNLAEAYFSIKAYDKATEYYLKALNIQEILNDTKGVNESNSQLAILYSMNKEHRKAIEYYTKVLNANQSNDSIRGQISAKLGGEYLQFNDFTNASKYLLEGLNINRQTKNETGLLTSLNNLGALNLQQKRLLLAERQLLEAGAIAKRIDNKQELLTYYGLMKTLDSTKRRFDRAFIWQREYYDLKNKLNTNTTSVSVIPNMELESDLNITETSTSNNLSAANNQEVSENKEKMKRFKLLFYILLAALIIMGIFLALIYSKRNDNVKYVQELEEKNLKIELQNEAFAEQTKHLENVNEVKDKLFSIISHDLKDSLSSINGFINLLKDGSLSREEFDNLIPELSENANNASLLLFNLLNWSKSQMQSLEPKPSLFDIQDVFEDKVKLIEQRMESKGINLVDHSLRDFAYADKSMIEIVIQNLLANALKFCNGGDTITVSNHISNGHCILSVADTGVGISKENIDKLFKSSSFTTTGTNNEKGTGLGLSICKELVELNKGKIWVESTLNVGSTFYVQLPKQKPEI
ncbi:tetratricopeptide repeat-containing sensor histidine kinase [uncultured Algibacter sp.]|uniref:tetratricopeptide repeat-containing sensor histidine kinase n=1 Tax=uncultured Algibacter sp. TaxID=298659 RepID=UPI00260EA865|nr:tetratricopeptide repeat-containing sensor histidine kinase [uncultured Algibacter sp.]